MNSEWISDCVLSSKWRRVITIWCLSAAMMRLEGIYTIFNPNLCSLFCFLLRVSAFMGIMALLLSGCSGWEVDPSGSGSHRGSGLSSSVRENRDSSLEYYQSLHFIVGASSLFRAEQVARVSEKIYEKIMFDTNLFSFKPKENLRWSGLSNSFFVFDKWILLLSCCFL